ncbi:MAG: hypothetical protein A3B38_03525 [Candidatus Levybacteria bacterium RIFCSPLOWO2_01_FULL_36_13]|nr:MAG: hypothetical protein A2684_00460 [Candidatus Levybacteria bacterium RIFCSPHIGHO2_01_FULL_36_15b]OGH34208.1 MAG: hypothetical protein A3B38_03525 [Candidatus Levybacteria bacterium RIFCSPLOWO2_01_FULL_36_13]
MDWLYILFNLANLLGFIMIGTLIAYFVQKDWKKLKNIPTRKFVTIVAAAAVFGGLFSFLINGMGNISNAMTNMFIACAFALFAIVPYSFGGKSLT